MRRKAVSAKGGAGGAAASGNPGQPGGFNATPVFNYSGSANGASAAGSVASALSSSQP